mgnify:CR=1 FL=1
MRLSAEPRVRGDHGMSMRIRRARQVRGVRMPGMLMISGVQVPYGIGDHNR